MYTLRDNKKRKIVRWEDGGLLVFEYENQAEKYRAKVLRDPFAKRYSIRVMKDGTE